MIVSFRGSDLNMEYFWGIGVTNYHDECRAIKVDPSHRYMIVGLSTRYWANSNTYDYMLIKADPATGVGEKITSLIYGNQQDYLMDMDFSFNGESFYVTGECDSLSSYRGALWSKFDRNNEFQWIRHFDNTYYDDLNSIAVSKD